MKKYRVWQHTEVVYYIEAKSKEEAIAIAKKKKIEDASWIIFEDSKAYED